MSFYVLRYEKTAAYRATRFCKNVSLYKKVSLYASWSQFFGFCITYFKINYILNYKLIKNSFSNCTLLLLRSWLGLKIRWSKTTHFFRIFEASIYLANRDGEKTNFKSHLCTLIFLMAQLFKKMRTLTLSKNYLRNFDFMFLSRFSKLAFEEMFRMRKNKDNPLNRHTFIFKTMS